MINEKVKIKTIEKGRQGGRWYLGNSIVRVNASGENYETKKHEYLKTDGILLFKQENNENIVYIYKEEEKMINFYSQTK